MVVIAPLRFISTVSHLPRSPCSLLLRRLSPVAAASDPETSTSNNFGTPRMLSHTVPLPFIYNPEAPSLSTSINGFRLDDRSTKSIAASNRAPSNHNQAGKRDAQFLSLLGARILLDVSGEPCRHPVANYPARQYIVSSVSHIPSPPSSIGRLKSSMAGC